MSPTKVISEEPLTQEELFGKLYQDLATLATELAIDRCRTRVLLKVLEEKLGLSSEEMDDRFREELANNLEPMIRDLLAPILPAGAEMEMQGGCCGGGHEGHDH